MSPVPQETTSVVRLPTPIGFTKQTITVVLVTSKCKRSSSSSRQTTCEQSTAPNDRPYPTVGRTPTNVTVVTTVPCFPLLYPGYHRHTFVLWSPVPWPPEARTLVYPSLPPCPVPPVSITRGPRESVTVTVVSPLVTTVVVTVSLLRVRVYVVVPVPPFQMDTRTHDQFVTPPTGTH